VEIRPIKVIKKLGQFHSQKKGLLQKPVPANSPATLNKVKSTIVQSPPGNVAASNRRSMPVDQIGKFYLVSPKAPAPTPRVALSPTPNDSRKVISQNSSRKTPPPTKPNSDRRTPPPSKNDRKTPPPNRGKTPPPNRGKTPPPSKSDRKTPPPPTRGKTPPFKQAVVVAKNVSPPNELRQIRGGTSQSMGGRASIQANLQRAKSKTPPPVLSPKESPPIVTRARGNTVATPESPKNIRTTPFAIKGGIQVGTKVIVNNAKRGVVRYLGPIPDLSSTDIYVGVELSKPEGKNNGSVKGVEYFKCGDNYGVFVSVDRVAKLDK